MRGAWLTPALLTGAFAAIVVAERRRPLRKGPQPEGRRLARNFAMAGLTATVTAALQKPLVDRVLRKTTARRLGLLNLFPLPRAIRLTAGVLLLNYTLWWWHRLNHVAPPLWRFHLVHHVDRGLDASTAFRFHFCEMALASFFCAAQVRLLGVDPIALLVRRARRGDHHRSPGWKGRSDVSLGKLLALPFTSRPAEAGPA